MHTKAGAAIPSFKTYKSTWVVFLKRDDKLKAKANIRFIVIPAQAGIQT
jgi:hypothetical protein